MFRLFFSHIQANMEPEFRYITCAPNGIPLRLQKIQILLYFTILNYELFCKHNGIPLGAHFIYLNSGSILA